MPYTKIEPTGCNEFHGNVRVRFSFFLEPGDARYGEQHVYVVDESCPIWQAGYKGEIDVEGNPINQADYDKWVATCHHIWRDNPFHNHFIYADPDITNKEIRALAKFHLPNFYRAWREYKPIRSGWDVKHRIRPLRYEELDTPEVFTLRKAQCEQSAEEFKRLIISILLEGEGSTFPATSIDIGSAAIDRASTLTTEYTVLSPTNPANDTGVLDTFEFWFVTDATGVKAGTFYGSDTNYTSRDYELIGNVTSGSKQTFSGLDCDVTSGDFIGIYTVTGGLETGDGSLGAYYNAADQFGTGTQTYDFYSGARDNSLYGTGETPVTFIPTVMII